MGDDDPGNHHISATLLHHQVPNKINPVKKGPVFCQSLISISHPPFYSDRSLRIFVVSRAAFSRLSSLCLTEGSAMPPCSSSSAYRFLAFGTNDRVPAVNWGIPGMMAFLRPKTLGCLSPGTPRDWDRLQLVATHTTVPGTEQISPIRSRGLPVNLMRQHWVLALGLVGALQASLSQNARLVSVAPHPQGVGTCKLSFQLPKHGKHQGWGPIFTEALPVLGPASSHVTVCSAQPEQPVVPVMGDMRLMSSRKPIKIVTSVIRSVGTP